MNLSKSISKYLRSGKKSTSHQIKELSALKAKREFKFLITFDNDSHKFVVIISDWELPYSSPNTNLVPRTAQFDHIDLAQAIFNARMFINVLTRK